MWTIWIQFVQLRSVYSDIGQMQDHPSSIPRGYQFVITKLTETFIEYLLRVLQKNSQRSSST